MEHIDSVDGVLTHLLITEHQIYPFVQIFPYHFTFQRLSMNENKQSTRLIGPWRQDDIVDGFARLTSAKIEPFEIFKHLGKAEKFRNQFLYVGR